jgi:hypothetical protein
MTTPPSNRVENTMSEQESSKTRRSGGSAPSGPSPQYKALLEGKISSKEYVRQLKERVDAERSAEKRSIRRPAAA